MPVSYPVSLRNTRMTAVRDACANGTLQLLTAANAVVSTHTLSATGGTVATGTWTITFTSTTAAASASGTVTQARIRNSGGTDQVTGLTVGTSGADIIIQNTAINSGQDVTISSAAINHAA